MRLSVEYVRSLESQLAELRAAADQADEEYRDEIARLRQQRDHWMKTAMAFDEHLATMRVMWLEQPALRFGALETWMPTDAERAAVEVVTANYQQLCDKYGASEEDDATLSTLRSLLARAKHGK